MFGYMGFGMQSYVYKRRPRKPFDKHTKVPSFSPLTEPPRTFTPKAHKKENNIESALRLIIYTVFFLVVSVLLMNRLNTYFNDHRFNLEQGLKTRDNNAFNFLFNSGKRRLSRGNLEGAYKEFVLAYAIQSNHEELNQLLVETSGALCHENNIYCQKLERHLSDFN